MVRFYSPKDPYFKISFHLCLRLFHGLLAMVGGMSRLRLMFSFLEAFVDKVWVGCILNS